MRTRTRLLIGILVVTLAIAGISATGLASGETASTESTTLGEIELVLENEHVHVSDVQLDGDGLPSMELEERTIEIESATVETSGVDATVLGTTYEVGPVSIGIENVGVTLEDVVVGG